MKKFLFILLLILPWFKSYSDIMIDISKISKQNITPYVYFLKDKTRSLTTTDVEKSPNIKAIKTKSINDSHSWDNLWFKFTLKNGSLKHTTRYLSITGSFPGNYIFYLKIHKQWIKQSTFGTSLKPKERSVVSTNATIPLVFKPGEKKEILLKRHSHHLLSAKIIIEDTSSFFNSETQKRSRFFLFFGLAIMMLIINIFIFFYQKTYTQLTYLFFIASIIIFIASINGSLDLVDWGISPSIRHYAPAVSAFVLFISMLFIYHFLDIKHKSHYIYKFVYIPIFLTPIYILLYLFGIDKVLAVPSGKYLEYYYTFCILIGISILITALKEKVSGSLILFLSLIAFILPIIYWLCSEFYFEQSEQLNSESAFLIGTTISFFVLNIRSFYLFKISYEKNQESKGDVIITEKYQNILRMLTHDLSTPMMTIKTCIKKIDTKCHREEIQTLTNKISSGEKELEVLINDMRDKEKESSDIALNINIERLELLNYINQSLTSLPFNTDKINIEISSLPSLTILADKALLYNEVFIPIFSFIIPLFSKHDKLQICCEKDNKYVYLSFKCFSDNKTINILPMFHDKLETHFNFEVIDSLEDIRQILAAYKPLNAMGATIQFHSLTSLDQVGTSIILSFSC